MYESFMIYESFDLELWYQHCTVILEIKSKIRTSFKSLVSKKARTWRLERIIFYKKLYLPVITWNKKHLSKQVLPMI